MKSILELVLLSKFLLASLLYHIWECTPWRPDSSAVGIMAAAIAADVASALAADVAAAMAAAVQKANVPVIHVAFRRIGEGVLSLLL